MISRVAENAFWLQRYVERASSLSRLMLTFNSGVLDAESNGGSSWAPVLTTTGEYPRFRERYGDEAHTDTRCVLEYLTWDDECSVSIRNSVAAARENARVIRETISREVWETVNREWLWIDAPAARAEFRDDPSGFFRRVRDSGHQFRGAVLSTMPHAEPIHFMSLGLAVETIDQTARVLDVTHYAVPEGTTDQVAESVAWIQALLACGAYEAFFKTSAGRLRARRVAEFLLLNQSFPRSVRHCLGAAARELEAIRALGGDTSGDESAACLERLRELVEERSIEQLFEAGIHEELTRVVDGIADFGSALYPDFFSPATADLGPDQEIQ